MTERHSMTRLGTVRGAGRAVRENAERPVPGWPAVVLRVVGSGLLIAIAAIHLDLYLTGYRTIPTIGWLFLLQVIAAFGLGLAVLAIPRRPAAALLASRLAAAAEPASPWLPSAAISCRSGSGCSGSRRSARAPASPPAWWRWPLSWSWPRSRLFPAPADRGAAAPAGFPTQIPPAAARAAGMTAAGLAVAALVLFGLALTGANSTAPAATGTGGLKTATISGTTVLTNAKGFTLYSFAPDTPTASKCYGSCAAYWPPVTGTTAAGQGLPGKVGTIKRTDGTEQLTYNGHPLYTYIGDSAPGQAKGNNPNLNGGLWNEVPVSR